MNIESVKSLFTLFTGEEDIERFSPVIDLAVIETERMLLPDADTSDIRLNFLSASIAAYRLRQLLSSREREKYTYGGKMLSAGSGSSLAYAERLLRDYLELCGDLIKPRTFVFMSCSGGKEK